MHSTYVYNTSILIMALIITGAVLGLDLRAPHDEAALTWMNYLYILTIFVTPVIATIVPFFRSKPEERERWRTRANSILLGAFLGLFYGACLQSIYHDTTPKIRKYYLCEDSNAIVQHILDAKKQNTPFNLSSYKTPAQCQKWTYHTHEDDWSVEVMCNFDRHPSAPNQITFSALDTWHLVSYKHSLGKCNQGIYSRFGDNSISLQNKLSSDIEF